ATGVNNIIFGFVRDYRPFGIGSLLAQFLQSILQPLSSPTGDLVLGLKSIELISIGDGISNLSRPVRVARFKTDLNCVGSPYTLDLQSFVECLQGAVFRRGPIGCPRAGRKDIV